MMLKIITVLWSSKTICERFYKKLNYKKNEFRIFDENKNLNDKFKFKNIGKKVMF